MNKFKDAMDVCSELLKLSLDPKGCQNMKVYAAENYFMMVKIALKESDETKAVEILAEMRAHIQRHDKSFLSTCLIEKNLDAIIRRMAF